MEGGIYYMTITDFINVSKAKNNHNGTWSVFIILKNLKESELIVENCNSEYEAYERSFLYLKQIILSS
jgi:hypothetical protein